MVFVDTGIAGFAIACALISLLIVIMRQRRASMMFFCLMSICIAGFCIGRTAVYQAVDPVSSLRYTTRAEAFLIIAFGLLPFLYRSLTHQKYHWIDTSVACWYGVLSLVNVFRQGGILWNTVSNTHLQNQGWFGTVYLPSGQRAPLFYAYEISNMIVMIYCVFLVTRSKGLDLRQRLVLLVLPATAILNVLQVIGIVLGWWQGPFIVEFTSLTLYLGLGLSVFLNEQQRNEEKDLLLAKHEEGEQQLKRILDNLSLPIVWATSPRMAYINPRFEKMFGYSHEDIPTIDAWFERAYPDPDHRDKVRTSWRKVLESSIESEGIIEPTVFLVTCKDGNQRQVEISGTLLHDSEVIAFNDITEKVETARALQESELKFRTIFECSPLMLGIANLENGTFIDANAEGLRVSGYTLEEIQGKGSVEVGWISEEDRAKLLKEVFEKGHVTGLELQFRAKDGHLIDTLVNAERVSISGHDCMITAAVDITERKQVERELRKYESRLALAVTATSDGIWEVRLDNNEVFFSPRWYEMLGYENEELPMSLDTFPKLCHPDDLVATNALIEEITSNQGQGQFRAEYRMLRKDGSWAWMLGRGKVVERTPDGAPLVFSGTNIDISERKRTEQELRETISQLNAAQHMAKIGFWSVDLPERVVAWSEGVKTIFDLPTDAPPLNIDQFLACVAKEDLEFVLERTESQLNPSLETEFQYSYRITSFANKVKVIEHRGHQEYDEKGNLMRVTGSILDITERRQAEEALRHLNRELRAISDCNQMLLRASDEQQLIEEVCRIICDEAGYQLAWVGFKEADEHRTVRPMAWAGPQADYVNQIQIYWSDDAEGSSPTGTAIRKGQTIIVDDFSKELKEGPWKEFAFSHDLCSNIALPLLDLSMVPFGALTIYANEPGVFVPHEVRLLEELAGDLAYGINTLRLRQENERAESLLVESNIRSSALFHNAPMYANLFHIVRDKEGRMVDWVFAESNKPQGVDSLHLQISLVGKLGSDIYSQGEFLGHLDRLRKVDESGEARMEETFSELVDRYFLSSIFKVGSDYLVSFSTDITEIKRVEERITKINQELESRVAQRTTQLEQANQELESFSYSVSHDLRAPLRHINGFSNILREHIGDSLDEEGGQYLSTITRASERMGQLIDGLLSFARMARCEINQVDTDLNSLVHEVRNDLQLDYSDRQVDWHFGPLPIVSVDRTLIRSALLNLMSNALKFTREREKAVITIECQEADGEYVISVQDNGVGFDGKYSDKLFGVFQRLHSSDQFDGTGIGLANVRRIVTRHGGVVWAKSAVGQGATFYFTLPRDASLSK